MNLIIENMNYLELSAFVRVERKKQGLNQQQLADKAGVSVKSVQSIEDFKTVRQNTIIKVLEGLKYTADIETSFKIKPLE